MMWRKIFMSVVGFVALFLGWKLFLLSGLCAAIAVGCLCFGKNSFAVLFTFGSLLLLLESVFVLSSLLWLRKNRDQLLSGNPREGSRTQELIAGGFFGSCVGTFAGLFVGTMVLFSGNGTLISCVSMFGIVIVCAALLAAIPDVGGEILGQILNALS